MGYYSDYGLRLEFKEEVSLSYLVDLFNSFLVERELQEEYDFIEWLTVDEIFPTTKIYQKGLQEKRYIMDICGYEMKFYNDYDCIGRWVDLFVDWLDDKKICEFHFIRVGESWEDIEEIFTDNVEFPLSMIRKIDFE